MTIVTLSTGGSLRDGPVLDCYLSCRSAEETAILIDLLALVYLAGALALALFTSGIWVLLVLWLRHRNDPPPPTGPIADWPRVTVQLPVYNEYAVVDRLLEAVAALEYPRERLHVQVLDDSDDATAERVAALVRQHRRRGLDIAHVQRPDRVDYKAGALAYGLGLTDAELVATFDADFVPPPDFLRRTVPHFVADAGLGIVQCRWAHLNADQNLITRAQAMSIDGHFVVEQSARGRGGLLVSFNGTGGLWRRTCIEDAGGWSGRTITEDLDLSYRAQMRGWRFLYLPEVAVPAEIPPQVMAYKRQQARWARGTTQNLRHLLRPLWRAGSLSLKQKLMGTLHLCQYLPHPLLLLVVLLTPPLLLAGALARLPLAPLGLVGIGPPLMYALSQRDLYPDWRKRLLALPLLLATGSGMILNNSAAVLGAFAGGPGVFKRTPKFATRRWQDGQYALRMDWTTLGEIVLALYMLAGVALALRLNPGIAPFLLMQAYGFGVMAAFSVMEEVQVRRYRPRRVPKRQQPDTRGV